MIFMGQESFLSYAQMNYLTYYLFIKEHSSFVEFHDANKAVHPEKQEPSMK